MLVQRIILLFRQMLKVMDDTWKGKLTWESVLFAKRKVPSKFSCWTFCTKSVDEKNS
jgi:hypothetical protein